LRWDFADFVELVIAGTSLGLVEDLRTERGAGPMITNGIVVQPRVDVVVNVNDSVLAWGVLVCTLFWFRLTLRR